MLATIALLSLALSDLPPAAVDSKLNADEFAKASKGEVVVKGEVYKKPDGKDAARGKAWVVVNATPDQCWAILMKYEEFPQFMPRLKKATVLSRSETGLKVTQEVKIALSTYVYTLDFTFDQAKHSASWALDPKAKNDIRDTTGNWLFRELPDNKTLLEYTIAVDSGMAVPGFVTNYLTQRDLPDVLLSFKKRVESGGKWTKE